LGCCRSKIVKAAKFPPPREGWVQEARLVWTLSDVYDEHPMFENAERSKERYEALKAKGEEIKRQQDDAAKKEPQ
jgi:hypothetical protein